MTDYTSHLIKIKGKEYLEVKWRLAWFREKFPHGRIITQEMCVDLKEGYARFLAQVEDGEGGAATGTATEWAKNMPAGLTPEDYLEKAETRAIGRALACLGIGTQFVGEDLSEGTHVADSPVSGMSDAERQQIADNRHPSIKPYASGDPMTLPRKPRAGSPAGASPSNPPAASGEMPGPFVDSAPQGNVLTGAQATAAPTVSESNKKGTPRQPRGGSVNKVHAGMDRKQLLQALKAQFTRLCGTNQQDARDLSVHVFGSGVDGWGVVEQLKDDSLRRGLAKMEPMKKDEPPAVPSGGFVGAPSKGTSSPAQDRPPVMTSGSVDSNRMSADGSTASAIDDKEDVPHFPPPEGSTSVNQPGPTQEDAPGSNKNNGGSPIPSVTDDRSAEGNLERVGLCPITQEGTGYLCQRKLHTSGFHYFAPTRPGEGLVKLPDESSVIVVDGYISTSDMMMLRRWCEQQGYAALFSKVADEGPSNLHGNPLLTIEQWRQLTRGVNALAGLTY